MIFDDPAEQEDWQRPQSGPREGKLSNQGGHAVRARCMNLLFSSQVYSTKFSSGTCITAVSRDTVELGGTELGRCSLPFSAGSSKIKILTSLFDKAS